jgi:hypothetical protein
MRCWKWWISVRTSQHCRHGAVDRDNGNPFLEECIGTEMVATSASHGWMIRRNQQSVNRDWLRPHSGAVRGTVTIREEVNVQCAK